MMATSRSARGLALLLVLAITMAGVLGHGRVSAQTSKMPQLHVAKGNWESGYRALVVDWEPNATVAISHESADGTVVESASATADSSGSLTFDAPDTQLSTSDRVSVSGPGVLLSVTAPDLTADFDSSARRIIVRAAPTTDYHVFSCANVASTAPSCDLSIAATTDAEGVLAVDFPEAEVGDVISVATTGVETSFQAEVMVPGFLPSLPVPDEGPGRVLFSGGTLDQLIASVGELGGVRIWAYTVDGWRTHGLEAPGFANRAFDEHFSSGVPQLREMTLVR